MINSVPVKRGKIKVWVWIGCTFAIHYLITVNIDKLLQGKKCCKNCCKAKNDQYLFQMFFSKHEKTLLKDYVLLSYIHPYSDSPLKPIFGDENKIKFTLCKLSSYVH